MRPHRLTLHIVFLTLLIASPSLAQKRKAPSGGKIAVVVDERLSALRETPDLRSTLVRRLAMGRLVAIRTVKTTRDGIVFYLVNVTSRTHGWLQREALVSASHLGDDQRLLHLIEHSVEFDRIVRARIFLDQFPSSQLRPAVLLLLGDSAEQASEKLTRDADKRVDATAPIASYFLNYRGLDRYNRQRVRFVFDEKGKRLHYDGSAWRELVRRYPNTKEADEARTRFNEQQ